MKVRATCPDCNAPMEPIRMVDQTHGLAHKPMVYAEGTAKPSFWVHQVPVLGTVRAVMCSDCGLIRLYGERGA